MSNHTLESKFNYTKNELPILKVHSIRLPYEDFFTTLESAAIMNKYWKLSILLVACYMVAIYLGVRYMRSRPKYNLRWLLFIWNVGLTTVYVLGLCRTLPEVYKLGYSFTTQAGLYTWVCQDCALGCTRVSNTWTFLFVLCKAPELIDTFFVVVRKQPLFFLHYYHHCTVLIFTWYLYGNLSSIGLTYAVMNAVVHALMYFYYSLKALSIHVPRPVSMGLTLIQLSQMGVGILVNYYAYTIKQQGLYCSVSYTDIIAAYAIYVSYFILFLWYFYQAYIAKDLLIIKKFKGEKIE